MILPFFFPHHFYFLAQLEGGFTLSDLLDVDTGVVPFPPRYVPSIFIAHRVQHSHCQSVFIECCQLTLSRFPLTNFYARQNPCEYVHSVRIELAKLILVGTRITYQATGDATIAVY